MTLSEVIRRHDLYRVEGHDYSRWVIVSTDKPTPTMFGELHMATDYSMCGALPRERGMVFMFQRNAKPVKREDE